MTEQVEKVDERKYVDIDVTALKKPYNLGRYNMKVSLTGSVYDALEHIGAIQRIVHKDQLGREKTVTKKGGYGSPFIEFGIELLLLGLSVDEDQKTKLRNRVRQGIKNMMSLDDREVFLGNLRELLEELE